MTISFIFISFLYFFGSSTALSLGIGYYTLYRPIIAGMITGMILGDMTLGMLTGAVVNIIYIDFISTGGSLKGDQCLTGIIGAIAAFQFSLSPIEAAALAYPFGYAGILIWKYRLSINSIFVRRFEEKYKAGLNPDITIYNGVLPQLLLYAMSTAVIAICVLLLNLFSIVKSYSEINNILFLFGVFLIYISLIKIFYNVKNKYGKFVFLVVFLLTLIFDISSAVLFLLTLLVLFVLIFDKNMDKGLKTNKKENIVITKKDLFYSWFIWMNFSHSCYSFARLQGFAFAHSMKNIFKKLYKDENIIYELINDHTEFFNTEPNMGTPIHGSIIHMEEQKSIGSVSQNISYIKKGMMGIAAGLGDSYTQVVLTPLFISLSMSLCFDEYYLTAVVPVVMLGMIIIYISYTGWMNGYYLGKESLIKRINAINKNKIKKYFPIIFSAILGCSAAKLALLNTEILYSNLFSFSMLFIIAFIFSVFKKIIGNKEKI